MLGTLEKGDAEAYTLLKARQDVRLAQAGVRLQDLRVQVSKNGEQLVEL
jgi:predicted transglutaminase-like cysteine proteinase